MRACLFAQKPRPDRSTCKGRGLARWPRREDPLGKKEAFQKCISSVQGGRGGAHPCHDTHMGGAPLPRQQAAKGDQRSLQPCKTTAGKRDLVNISQAPNGAADSGRASASAESTHPKRWGSKGTPQEAQTRVQLRPQKERAKPKVKHAAYTFCPIALQTPSGWLTILLCRLRIILSPPPPPQIWGLDLPTLEDGRLSEPQASFLGLNPRS